MTIESEQHIINITPEDTNAPACNNAVHERGKRMKKLAGEAMLDAKISSLVAEQLHVNVSGEPIPQLDEDEMRAYSYALKKGLNLPKAEREKRLELMRGLCNTGELPPQINETLGEHGAIDILPNKTQKQIRMANAISAVRTTIKGLAPQLFSRREGVPEFFVDAYRKAINAGTTTKQVPVEAEDTVVFRRGR